MQSLKYNRFMTQHQQSIKHQEQSEGKELETIQNKEGHPSATEAEGAEKDQLKSQEQVQNTHEEDIINQEIKNIISSIGQEISEEQLKEYIEHEKAQKRPVTRQGFEEWSKQKLKSQKELKNQQNAVEIQLKENPKEKAVDVSHIEKVEVKQGGQISQPKGKEEQKEGRQVKVEEKKGMEKGVEKELSSVQICNQFLQSLNSKEKKPVKTKLPSALNYETKFILPITTAIIEKYQKSNTQTKNLETFKKWLDQQTNSLVKQTLESFSNATPYKSIQEHSKTISQILQLATQQSNSLKINVNVGQLKGKTRFKYELFLKQNLEQNFQVCVHFKTKKKDQFKKIYERYQKTHFSQQFNIFQLCELELKDENTIIIRSKVFESHIIHSLIERINESFTQKHSLKVEGELYLKNSLKLEQNGGEMRFVKWMSEGFNFKTQIEGSNQIVQHFVKSFIEIFPFLKSVKGGQFNLKLKSPENIDKFFDKLGISTISQQTPSLSEFIKIIFSQYVNPQSLPLVGDIIFKIIQSCCSSSEKIVFDVGVKVSHLNLNMQFSGDSSKQLNDITNQLFPQKN